MVLETAIPSEFGGSWETFAREWCCGGSLGYSADEAARALSILRNLWPEEVSRLVNEPCRGLVVAASTIELGLLLDVCQPVDGFQNVLRRLANGQRSAYSELVLVTVLQRLGHATRFEPPLDGHVLDAVTEIDGFPVYFEVVAPERSDASAEDQRLVDNLTADIRARFSKCRVEIEICSSLDAGSNAAIITAIESAMPSTWIAVDSMARIRRIDAGQALLPTFDGEGAQVVVAGERLIQGESTNVIARWESSDARAKRIFNEEYHQFSPTVANVLVVNVCAVSDGMNLWPMEMTRLLQPTRNRKVGAVAFFEQGSLGPPEAIRRRWRVLVNPHAHIPVPERLLIGIESFDESSAYGLPRLERIVAT
jgi:hypothetical protein